MARTPAICVAKTGRCCTLTGGKPRACSHRDAGRFALRASGTALAGWLTDLSPSPDDHRGLRENLAACATRLWPYGPGLWALNHITRGSSIKACMRLARRAAIVTGAGVACAAFLVATVAGCSSPTQPSVSVSSGRPVSPASGAQFSYYNQPITLVVANGVATGGASPITAGEVATDAAFNAVVTTQAVTVGANGQLTITLDHLAPATTYYWRVKTTAGDNPGVYSSSASFSIGPMLVFQPPTPVQPLADSFPHKRPTFTVKKEARTGPPATVTYRFDVTTYAAFSSVVATGTVP